MVLYPKKHENGRLLGAARCPPLRGSLPRRDSHIPHELQAQEKCAQRDIVGYRTQQRTLHFFRYLSRFVRTQRPIPRILKYLKAREDDFLLVIHVLAPYPARPDSAAWISRAYTHSCLVAHLLLLPSILEMQSMVIERNVRSWRTLSHKGRSYGKPYTNRSGIGNFLQSDCTSLRIFFMRASACMRFVRLAR